MTKREYLEKLQRALAAQVPELEQEVMEDYETHFEMGLKNGKTEEQLCEELGDVDEFVAELAQMEKREQKENTASASDDQKKEAEMKEEAGAKEGAGAGEETKTEEEARKEEWKGSRNTRHDSNWSEAFNSIQSGVAEIFSDIQNNVQGIIHQEKVQEFIHQGEEVLYQTGNIIQEKVQEYFKGPAFEGTEERGSGETEDAELEREERRATDKKNLVLDGVSADIIVEPSEDDTMYINYENMGSVKQRMQYRFYCREEGDTVYAGVRKSKTAAGLFWGSFSPAMVLTVKLPKSAGMVELHTASGDISMKGVQAREFRLSSASGNMKLYRASAEAMRANTMSGDVQADQMEIRCLEIQSKSGDIRADDMSGEAFLLKSMSGDVESSYVNCKECSISSTSGDIKGRNMKVEQMACTSTSGDVQIQGEFDRCRVESVSGDATLTTGRDLEASIASVSGDVRLNLSNDNRGFEADYKTVSGELEIRYGSEHQYLTRNGRVERGEKASRIYLKTVSGDMTVSD